MALTKVSRGLLSTGIVDNSNATAITLNADESATFAGNVGIGVTPEAWNTYTPLQVQLASLVGYTNGDSRLSNNAYYSSGWKYINSIPATQYLMDAANGIHTWSTAASGTADAAITWQERMRISGSSVGIGVSSPQRTLVLGKSDSTGVQTQYTNSTTGAGLGDGFTVGIDGSENAEFWNFENTNMLFATNGTERLRITSAGAVELTGPGGAGETFLNFTADSNTTKAQISGAKAGASGGRLVFSTTNSSGTLTESMRIDGATGNTGIGAVPSAWRTAYADKALDLGTHSALYDQFGGSTFLANNFYRSNDNSFKYKTTRGATAISLDAGQIGFLTAPSGTAGATATLTTRMHIDASGAITMPAVYNDTTAAAANMHISSAGGLLFRSTSSARYKNTITDATHGLTELLTLRPVTYKGNNDGDTVFGGLIAEEVHDAGLTEFVQYNDEDEPDALAYGNMVSLCIKAIQELKEELNTATARITELENN